MSVLIQERNLIKNDTDFKNETEFLFRVSIKTSCCLFFPLNLALSCQFFIPGSLSLSLSLSIECFLISISFSLPLISSLPYTLFSFGCLCSTDMINGAFFSSLLFLGFSLFHFSSLCIEVSEKYGLECASVSGSEG